MYGETGQLASLWEYLIMCHFYIFENAGAALVGIDPVEADMTTGL